MVNPFKASGAAVKDVAESVQGSNQSLAALPVVAVAAVVVAPVAFVRALFKRKPVG